MRGSSVLAGPPAPHAIAADRWLPKRSFAFIDQIAVLVPNTKGCGGPSFRLRVYQGAGRIGKCSEVVGKGDQTPRGLLVTPCGTISVYSNFTGKLTVARRTERTGKYLFPFLPLVGWQKGKYSRTLPWSFALTWQTWTRLVCSGPTIVR